MAARGRGRGRGGGGSGLRETTDGEEGEEKKSPTTLRTTKGSREPPPLFPPFENIPQPEPLTPVETMLVRKAQQMAARWRNSPQYFLSPPPEEDKEIERYTDKYKKKPTATLEQTLRGTALAKLYPIELFSSRVALAAAKRQRAAAKDTPLGKITELEKKESEEKPSAKKAKKRTEEEIKKEGEQEEEEELPPEEEEEEFFDNLEEYANMFQDDELYDEDEGGGEEGPVF